MSFCVVKTTLHLPGKGLDFSGKDSQVLRPIITAFCLPEPQVRVVISLKCFKSAGKCQAKPPFLPKPFFSSIATTMEKGFIFKPLWGI